MNDRDPLADRLADLVDESAPPIAFDEVVNRAPATRLRRPVLRRRRLVAAAIAVTVVAAAIVVVVVSRDGSSGRPHRIVVAPSTTETAPVTTTTDIASGYTRATATGEMGVIAPGVGWRLDGLALSRTDDDGAHWRDITPPSAVDQDPIARINWVFFLDSQHVWAPVSLNHTPFTIYRSRDGGDTWQVACAGSQCGGSSDVTFVDAQHGWGLGYDSKLFETNDGGTTWAAIGTAPFLGPLHFVNRQVGWAVSEPGGYAQPSGLPTDPGGSLYRTRDGGHTWQRAQLPALTSATEYQSVSFGDPQFFGNDGVVVVWLEPSASTGSHDQVAVYTTHDGGDSWTGRLAPADPGADRYGNVPQLLAPEFPFSAFSATDWMLFVGPHLYVTHDAGSHWQTLTPDPPIRDVYTLDLTSPSSAWALASVPLICHAPRPAQQPCTLETLVHTIDGGESWPVVPLP